MVPVLRRPAVGDLCLSAGLVRSRRLFGKHANSSDLMISFGAHERSRTVASIHTKGAAHPRREPGCGPFYSLERSNHEARISTIKMKCNTLSGD